MLFLNYFYSFLTDSFFYIISYIKYIFAFDYSRTLTIYVFLNRPVNAIPSRLKSGFLNNRKLIKNLESELPKHFRKITHFIFHYFLTFFLSVYLFSKYNISKISSKQFCYFSIFFWADSYRHEVA